MQKVYNPESSTDRRNGLKYELTPAEIEQYRDQGYIVLNDVLTDAEVATLDERFDYFVAGKHEGMERDFCDMSQPYGTPIEQFQLVNAMLPSHYCDELKNNIFIQVAATIAAQLSPAGEVMMDYDQFLAKRPGKKGAQFHMHQDLGYWPKTKNTWTATCSLALTDADVENGCLMVVPGTNREPTLRSHKPIEFSGASDAKGNRDDAHTLVMEAKPTDSPVYLPVKRGSITVHDERIVHGSAGNSSDHWRKTYVMAFRLEETVNEERAMGFTHSHNDEVKWDTFIS